MMNALSSSKALLSDWLHTSTLRWAVIVSVTIALAIPGLAGYLIERHLEEQAASADLASDARKAADVLAVSLSTPLWELSTPGVDAIVRAMIADERFVSITVTESATHRAFLKLDRPQPNADQNLSWRQAIVREGQELGDVEVVMTLAPYLQAAEGRLRRSLFQLSAILLTALAAIYFVLRRKLLVPIERLTAEAHRIADENFSCPIPATGNDEFGRVAGAMEYMRLRLLDTFSELNTLAFFDQLSGLPNRVLLVDRIKQAFGVSSRTRRFGALLFIDLDNFKTLNDTKGHEMGDQLLKQVASRLKQSLREGDTAARVGGDEFIVVLSDLGIAEKEAASTTEAVAEKILAALNQTYQIGDLAHRSTASIGATLFMGQDTPVDELMKQADLAMYRAKASGRNVVCFFDPAMEAAVKARAELEEDLRRAIDENQFLLHYQPQVVGEGRVTGAEALIRWQHPRRGLVSPAEFIPLAEENDHIVAVGRWVLEAACARLATWASDPKLGRLTIAVNVSAKQFLQTDFVDQVLTAVEMTGADPHYLKLELTESLLVHDVEQVIGKMYALKARGIGFSLDDFGTGYSSLSYLKRLPLDQLKIDQSFVRGVLSDPNDAVIAKAIVALAQSLGLAVIAEGVESRAHRDFLASSGCYAYQGELFGMPMPADSFETFMQQD